MSKLEAVGLSVVIGLIGFALLYLLAAGFLHLLDGSIVFGLAFIIFGASLLLMLIPLAEAAAEEWRWAALP